MPSATTTTTSRSAVEFLRRNGRLETPRAEHPRLDAGALVVHSLPVERERLDANLMTDADGNPPPDRGKTDQWPPAQEVSDDGS